MNFGKMEAIFSKDSHTGFFYQNKGDIFSILRLLTVIWSITIACIYFSVPDVVKSSISHTDLSFYVQQSASGLIVGSVLSIFALPMFIIYEHKALKIAVAANLILMFGSAIYVRLMPASDAQVARYEGCLNKLLNLDDEAKQLAYSKAKEFKGTPRNSVIENEIKQCITDAYDSVARVNQSLYSKINTSNPLTVQQIAAYSDRKIEKGFSLAQEDKMVSCLNELIQSDEMSAKNAMWIIDDLAVNGLTQSADQYITQCESNLALFHGKHKEANGSLAALIQKHKTQN